MSQLTRIDWLVIVDVAAIIAVIIMHSDVPAAHSNFLRTMILLSGISWPILIVSMLRGGANSSLWKWLPPFWPWGRILVSSGTRWCFVLVMVGASALGASIILRQL
jgi:hypothetical protein